MGNACTEGIKIFLSPFENPADREPSYILHGYSSSKTSVVRSKDNSQLLQAYDIYDVIGEGSYGTVRSARSFSTGGHRVLKSVHKRRGSCALLATEIKNQSSCKHPNIVHLFEVYETPAWIHMVLEVCEGGDLLDLVAKRKRLPEADAASVLRQVLASLCYLHGTACIAHRDLKLENVLLERKGAEFADNVVKVTDFGVSKAFAPGGRGLRTLCGTCEYMAPEMARGHYDEKCDVWSCGILLFILISGSYPFESKSPYELMKLAKAKPLPLEGEAWDPASPEVKGLLRQLCCRDPTERLSAEEAFEVAWVQEREQPSSPSRAASSSSLAESESDGGSTKAKTGGGLSAATTDYPETRKSYEGTQALLDSAVQAAAEECGNFRDAREVDESHSIRF